MIDPHSIFLLLCTLAAVVGLILLVTVFKLNPFLSLFLASLSIAIVAGMPLSTVIHSFETGVGGTLGHIAIVVIALEFETLAGGKRVYNIEERWLPAGVIAMGRLQ